MTNASLTRLLDLYPVSDFQADPAANLSAEFYRSGRILRDIIMVCQPILFGKHVHERSGKDFYLYEQDQTILTPILGSLGAPGLGVVHTSEFAYMFGNLSHYDGKLDEQGQTHCMSKLTSIGSLRFSIRSQRERLQARTARVAQLVIVRGHRSTLTASSRHPPGLAVCFRTAQQYERVCDRWR